MVGRLGQGGMGQVFLGVSPGGRPVAVKAIRPDLASDPQFRIRFAREVAAARTVSGMFTAMVVGADVDGPIAWLATAYVPGPSLAEAVNEHGPLPEASLLALAAGLAEALAAIHAAGVTHRDLKPSNVLLAEDGPRVIDFGISRAAESTTLTQTGLTIGSPGFMSPEQAIGTEVGPPSDIFSLGTVLAFAATGKGPFGGGTTASLLYRVVHETPDLDGVPAAVRPLIERCLVKEPAQRPTAVALLDAVGALQPTGNWLPDSVIRMAAAPPSLTPPPGQAAPTAVDGTPAPTAVPMPLVPGFAATQTSMADFAATPPYQATEAWSTPASGSPPLAPGDPPSGTAGPQRRRSRPLVLAAVIGVLVLGGVGAAFALSSQGHTPTQSRPAANVSPVTAAAKSASASASPSASKHPKASASASSNATTTQPATTSPATHASTAPTHTATTTPTTTPTTTTSPTPTTTTSPTPTTTTSPTPTATSSVTASSPAASSAPSTSAVAS
jgi:serine/threonine protein kinase